MVNREYLFLLIFVSPFGVTKSLCGIVGVYTRVKADIDCHKDTSYHWHKLLKKKGESFNMLEYTHDGTVLIS